MQPKNRILSNYRRPWLRAINRILALGFALAFCLPSLAQTVVKTENWDSSASISTYTTAGWTFSQQAQDTIDTSVFQSTPNSLKWTATGNSQQWIRWTTAQDGNSGDVVVSANIYLGATGSVMGGVYCRANGDPTATATNLYRAYIRQNSGLILEKRVSTTVTQIGSTVGTSATFNQLTWYNVRLRVQGGATPSYAVAVQRQSDGFWLNTSGTWVQPKVDAIAPAADSGSMPTAAGYGGVWLQTFIAASIQTDDFSLQRYADQSATGVQILPATDAIYASQTKAYRVALNPEYSSVGSNVSITLSSDSTGTFSGTSFTLSTLAPNAGFTYTPGATAVGTHTLTATGTGGLSASGTAALTVTYQPITAAIAVDSQNTNDTQVKLAVTSPTGGSFTGYTYQWYSSTTANGTYSAISAATTATLTRTAVQMGNSTAPLFFYCTIGDSVGNSGNTYTRQIGLTDAPINVAVVGDSILALDSVTLPVVSEGPWSTGTMIARYMSRMLGRPVSVYNAAASGSYASQWGNSDPAASTFQIDYNAGQFTGKTDLIIMLGMNDAVSGGHTGAQYQAYMITLVNYAIADGFTHITIQPPYAPFTFNTATSFSDATIRTAMDYIHDYQGVMANIKSGCSDPSKVKIGNTVLWRDWQRNQDNSYLPGYNQLGVGYSSDGVHPSLSGAAPFSSSSGGTNGNTNAVGGGGDDLGKAMVAEALALGHIMAWYNTGATGTTVRRVQGQ